MEQKVYTSFKEINRDLKILDLEREIEVEGLKLSVEQTKKSLYPTQLLGGAQGLLKKFLVSLVARKVFHKLKGDR